MSNIYSNYFTVAESQLDLLGKLCTTKLLQHQYVTLCNDHTE